MEVVKSDVACGFGNVAIDGQVLPQENNNGLLSGKGSITTKDQINIVGSWDFHCVKVNGVPDSQLLKLVVDVIDGKPVRDTGFSMLFRQHGMTEIINIETDLSIPDEVLGNPNPSELQPIHAGKEQPLEEPEFDIEAEMAELDYLMAQMHELKYLIHQKERALAHHAHGRFDEMDGDLTECDSLKCVAKAVAKEAKIALKHFYRKGGDHHHDETAEDFPHFKKPHFKFPKNPFHHGPPKNCTGPPKHGNFTHPPHKGNHTFPPGHKKPHHFLPMCRYPPPPPGDHYERPQFDEYEPPHHKGQHEGHHDGPGDFEGPPPKHHGHGPDGPGFDEHPHHKEQHQGPHDKSPEFHGPKPHARVFAILKFSIIGFLFAFLVIALHRRTCNPKSRASRQARREERHRRRAYRRAAHKTIITRLLARMRGNDSDDEDMEEKEAMLRGAEDGMSTTMTEEIIQTRNVAEIVGEMVDAEVEETRIPAQMDLTPATSPMPIRTSSVMPIDMSSQIGYGEDLPAYEDNDGSEMSSVIADGFRYTPDSNYTPSHSPSGSVSDILGPDTKN